MPNHPEYQFLLNPAIYPLDPYQTFDTLFNDGASYQNLVFIGNGFWQSRCLNIPAAPICLIERFVPLDCPSEAWAWDYTPLSANAFNSRIGQKVSSLGVENLVEIRENFISSLSDIEITNTSISDQWLSYFFIEYFGELISLESNLIDINSQAGTYKLIKGAGGVVSGPSGTIYTRKVIRINPGQKITISAIEQEKIAFASLRGYGMQNFPSILTEDSIESILSQLDWENSPDGGIYAQDWDITFEIKSYFWDANQFGSTEKSVYQNYSFPQGMRHYLELKFIEKPPVLVDFLKSYAFFANHNRWENGVFLGNSLKNAEEICHPIAPQSGGYPILLWGTIPEPTPTEQILQDTPLPNSLPSGYFPLTAINFNPFRIGSSTNTLGQHGWNAFRNISSRYALDWAYIGDGLSPPIVQNKVGCWVLCGGIDSGGYIQEGLPWFWGEWENSIFTLYLKDGSVVAQISPGGIYTHQYTPSDWHLDYPIKSTSEETLLNFIDQFLLGDNDFMPDSVRIKEIHQALDASKFAWGGPNTTRNANLGYYIERIARIAGISVNPDGSLRTIRPKKLVKSGETIPPGWYGGCFGVNNGGSLLGQPGGSSDEERDGIVYEIKSNNYDPEKQTIEAGGYALCENWIQYLDAIQDDLDKALGWQELGAMALPSADATRQIVLEGLASIISEVFFNSSALSINATETHATTLGTNLMVREVLSGLGLPLVEKVFEVDVGAVAGGFISYPAYAKDAARLSTLLFAVLQNLGFVVAGQIGIPTPPETQNQETQNTN